MKKGIIYKHTFPNGKCYVGKTVRVLDQRVKEKFLGYKNQVILWSAIRKYGVESIKTEVLYEAPVECLNTLEKLAICQYRSHETQNGYNCTWGGDGFDSETARKVNRKRVADGTP